MLVRLGNKTQLAPKLYNYFPPHRMRIELFFGAGGLFFNSPKADYNVLNDLDDDVANLYLVVTKQKDELYKAIEMMPVSSSLMEYWKKNRELDPVLKAVRFLFFSNFTYLGKGDTFRIGANRTKEKLLSRIEPTFKALGESVVTNYDFRDVIRRISFHKSVITKDQAFIYLDPVYLGTDHFYNVPKWTEDDTYDCFEIMSNEGIPAAMSEYRHPFVLEQAARRGFTVIPVKSCRSIRLEKTRS